MKNGLVINRFRGGLTDNYVGGRTDQYQKANNMVLTPDGKLQTRPGIVNAVGGSTRSRTALESNTSRRTGILASYEDEFILQQAETTLQYDNGTVMTNLQGPDIEDAFDGAITSDEDFACYSSWNEHLFFANEQLQRPIKVFKDTTLKLRTAGLPKPDSSPTAPLVAITANPETNPYIVALVYKYTYTVNGVDFVDRGSPRYFRRSNNNTVSSGALDNYVYDNGTAEHYEDFSTDFVIEYYRTTENGNVLFYVGECQNSTTTTAITDGISDDTLQDNTTMYVTGGIADNDRPPGCKYVHMTTTFGYYANGYEVDVDSANGTLYKTRLWQSKPSDPDSVPASFFIDVEDAITGISSIRSTPVVFTKEAVYRIDGQFDSFGRGGMIAQKITDTVGCVGHNSIVQTLDGLYFAGKDGFYFTDGYQITPLSDEFIETYRDLVDTDLKQKRIYGVYDDENRWVIWSVRGLDEGVEDNNQAYCFDLRAFRKGDMAFTTWSSGFDEDDSTGNYAQFDGNYTPSSFVMHNQQLHHADGDGYVYKYSASRLTDINQDTSVADVDSWDSLAIIYEYRSAAMDFNSPQIRKWASEVVVRAKGEIDETATNLTLQIKSDNDNEQEPSDLTEIRDLQAVPWGDPSYDWGDEELWSSRRKLFENKRRVPAGNMRCTYKQIIFTNSYSTLKNSDAYGTATVAGTGVTRTFTLASEDLLENSVFYRVAFSDDSYVKEYEITSQTGDPATYTLATPDDDLTSEAGKEWVVRGFKKGDVLSIQDYVVFYQLMSDSQAPFDGTTGENA